LGSPAFSVARGAYAEVSEDERRFQPKVARAMAAVPAAMLRNVEVNVMESVFFFRRKIGGKLQHKNLSFGEKVAA
jgi:hypothetical protein